MYSVSLRALGFALCWIHVQIITDTTAAFEAISHLSSKERHRNELSQSQYICRHQLQWDNHDCGLQTSITVRRPWLWTADINYSETTTIVDCRHQLQWDDHDCGLQTSITVRQPWLWTADINYSEKTMLVDCTHQLQWDNHACGLQT